MIYGIDLDHLRHLPIVFSHLAAPTILWRCAAKKLQFLQPALTMTLARTLLHFEKMSSIVSTLTQSIFIKCKNLTNIGRQRYFFILKYYHHHQWHIICFKDKCNFKKTLQRHKLKEIEVRDKKLTEALFFGFLGQATGFLEGCLVFCLTCLSSGMLFGFLFPIWI